MEIPAGLRYTDDHEWLRVEGGEGVIGITAYAAGECWATSSSSSCRRSGAR